MTSQRTAKTNLNRMLARAKQPFLLFDHERRVTYANPAAESVLGLSLEILSAEPCPFSGAHVEFPNPADWIRAKIGPPPELYKDLRYARFSFSPPDGSEVPGWTIHFHAMRLSQGEPAVIATFSEGGEVGDSAPFELSQQMRELVRQTSEFWQVEAGLDKFIGRSEASRELLVKAQAAIDSGANLLLVGPPGSGRERLARGIHHAWARQNEGNSEGMQEFQIRESKALANLVIPLDGSVADPELVQATFKELFELQSQFQRPRGRLLIRNVHQLDAASQNEILGLLRLRKYDFQISCTSTISLKAVDHSVFDHALASLLSTVEINVPGLAERVEDIPLLAQQVLERNNLESGKQLSGFEPDAIDALIQYPWPENLLELEQLVGQACDAAAAVRVRKIDLPEKIRLTLRAENYPDVPTEPIQLDKLMLEIESELILNALKKSKGNKSRAAELLGITRSRLIRKLESREGS